MKTIGPLERFAGHELLDGHYGPGLGITGPLVYEDAGDGENVVLLRPFVVQVMDRLIEVPRGFRTNFASIPWLFRRLIPRFGKWNVAAVVHDYIYERALELGISEREADAIYYDLCRRRGVAWWKARAMWAGLRIGGWRAWGKYRTAERRRIRRNKTQHDHHV